MQLEYISHSCFLIETQGIRIAFDPWIIGSAYGNQWQLFPKAVDATGVENADLILISHGHEDHFHPESLQRISKSAHVFFPFQWRSGVKSYLKHIGFSRITEAVSFRQYHFRNIRITYLGYSLESVIVIESEGKVLVNINDALNSNHETAVDFLLQKIKSKWPKIDLLLSGWSGAGYFPNKVKYKGKNDLEVARIREQYFADNFCKFTHYLQPKMAIPFAPGFVLLQNENRWINDIKFPRKVVADYFNDHFGNSTNISFPIMYPSDRVLDLKFEPRSIYHQMGDDAAIYQQLDTVFATEIEETNRKETTGEEEVELLTENLQYWMNRNKKLYPDEVVNDSIFSIILTDVGSRNCLNINTKNGLLVVNRSERTTENDRLIIKTKAKLLAQNLKHAWGGDLLTIGYGIEVEVFEELSLEKNLDIVCVRLISRYPIAREDMIRHTGRMLKYYLTNPALTNLWISQKIRLKPYVNKYPFNERDHWITYNKCELCKVCKIPEMEFEKLN